MTSFDFNSERRKLAEYESRPNFVEQRAPTKNREKVELENWSNVLKDVLRQAQKVNLGLSERQLESTLNVEMSDAQIRWHEENGRNVEGATIFHNGNGELLAIYIPHVLEIGFGKEVASTIVADVESAIKSFTKHYPPDKPKEGDKRFFEGYKNDKAKADANGWACGVHHIAFRR